MGAQEVGEDWVAAPVVGPELRSVANVVFDVTGKGEVDKEWELGRVISEETKTMGIPPLAWACIEIKKAQTCQLQATDTQT